MKEYVTRMIKEEEDLASKINKLNGFIESNNKEITLTQKNLLNIQLHSMISYDLVLCHRIALELNK